MKTNFILVFVCFCFVRCLSYSQSSIPELIKSGLGVTVIDNQTYYALHSKPELVFGKVGMGLDLNLEFDSHMHLRTENFNEFSDFVAVIRHAEYGAPSDPLYGKLGRFEGVTFGQGNIINNYSNASSYDTRMSGALFNWNAEGFGVQTLWSNFVGKGIFGARGYVRPFKLHKMVPVVLDSTVYDVITSDTTERDSTFYDDAEVGLTYVSDFAAHANSRLVPSTVIPGGLDYADQSSMLNAAGLDGVLHVFRKDSATVDFIGSITKIFGYGAGGSAGGVLRIGFDSTISARGKLEIQLNGDHYLPGYFNGLYEIDRANAVAGSAKSDLLANAIGSSTGSYMDLSVSVRGKGDVTTSYQRMNNVANSGIFTFVLNLAPSVLPATLKAEYDKMNVIDFADLLTANDRSYFFLELSYKPIPYIVTSLHYSWTFTPIRVGDDLVGYEPQRKLEPRIMFIYSL